LNTSAPPSVAAAISLGVYMLDIEMGFIKDHEEVLDMVQDMTHNALTNVYKEHADDLKSWDAPELTLKEKFPRYTVAQVHEMYTKATGTDTTNEKDLIPDEEKWICEYARQEQGCEYRYGGNNGQEFNQRKPLPSN
jgi:aspartyl/asparaginyl-tRNA synthetase